MWITDIHVGRTTTYDAGQPQDSWDYVAANFPGVAFVLATGDLADHSLTSEYVTFVAQKNASALNAVPWYFFPGNHDEGAGLDASGGTVDGPATYAEYDATGYGRRFSFVYQGYKFIGFGSKIRREPDPLEGFADVDAVEQTYLDTELASKGSNVPVVFAHFPVGNTLGNNIKGAPQTAVFNSLTTNGVQLYLHGHRHVDFVEYVEGGVTHVNGECEGYSVPNSIGAFNIITVSDNVWTFRTYLRQSPWTLLSTHTFTFVVTPATGISWANKNLPPQV